MNEFLKTLLSLSLSGTLLFLLVLMPRGLYRERFSRRWQYYIWLVVALRFLVPFAPGVTFTGYLFDAAGAAISAAGSNVGSGAFGLSGEAQTPDGQTDYINGKPDSQADYADGSSNGQADYPNGTPNGQADHADESPNSQADHFSGNPENSGRTTDSETAPPGEIRTDTLPYLQTGAFSLWLTVAAALLIRKATAYQSFLGFLKAASTQVSDIETLNLLSDCMEKLHISGKVELYTNPLIASPILTGFFRPRIILPYCQDPEPKEAAPVDAQQQTISTAMSAGTNCIPESPTGMPKRFAGTPKISAGSNSIPEIPTGTPERFTGTPGIRKKDLSYIFIHELIHYRRKDMFYKWFVQLILCVHWFNPFVYLLGKEVGRACELACDESVIAGLDDTEKKAYGNTLLASLQTGNAYKNPLASVTLTESARELKERLSAIMKTHKKTKSKTLLTVLATAAICTAFGTLGAYARSDSDNPTESTADANNWTNHSGNTEIPDNIESYAANNAPGSSSPGSADNAPGNGSPGNAPDSGSPGSVPDSGSSDSAPDSGSSDSRSLADSTASLPDGASYQQDGNIYYIYTEGTDLSDKPLASFTDGTIGVVLVRKGSYTSLGPFDRTADAEDFQDEITRLCQDMTASNKITQKDAQLILALADIIKDRFPDLEPDRSAAVSYTFVQRGYYQDSFIIELGWNLPAGGQTISQARRTAATLEDGSRMNVYFADAALEYADDSEALAAVGRLIDSLRKNNLKGYPDLETPLVSGIRKVDGSNLPALAREFMANQDLTGFSAVFPALDARAQEECCQALYEDADVAFFASIAPFLEEDLLLSFLDRADKDGNISFFTAMLITGSVPADRLSEDYAEKYYENDDIASFSAIVSFLPEKEQRRFLEKARKDQKAVFQKVLSDALSQPDALLQPASAAQVNTANSTGSSPSLPDSLTASDRIVYEGADILFYEDGSPYLRDMLVNQTNRTVTEAEYCILAYDSQGHPLQLQWNFMDSSAKAAYENLTRHTGLRLGPNQTTEAIPGGWSLSDEDAARISYAICCLKEVVFEDGTAWSNPDYEDWHEAYAGKEVSTEKLEDYYPCAYAVLE